MSKTKGDIVLLALRRAGIASSATLTQPEPQSVADALDDLELMVAELEGAGILLGYNFAPDNAPPDAGDDSGLQAGDINAIAYMLAKQVLIDNLRPVPDELANAANRSYEVICIRRIHVPQLQRRNDMPVGTGNKHGSSRERFYVEKEIITAEGNPLTL